MSMRGATGKTVRSHSVGFADDELGSANKRHRTRGAMSKRTLTAETVLVFVEGELSSEEEEDSEQEEQPEDVAPVYRPSTSDIEIPVVRTLTDEEMRAGGEGPAHGDNGNGVEVEPTSDEWYRRLHVVYEIKEQAFREQATRGGSSVRRLVNRTGPVSSTELLLAPAVERKLTKEDAKMVLGKMELPEVPEDRLRLIEGKLEQVEKSYEQGTQHYARYYLHTQWAPQVIVEPPPPAPAASAVEGQPPMPPPKPKLVLKLKRLQDKR
jgi:hypothetical protein